jgi:hypothetical protein
MQEQNSFAEKYIKEEHVNIFSGETYYIGEEESRMAELEMLEQGHQLYAVEGTPRAVQVLPGLSRATQVSRCSPPPSTRNTAGPCSRNQHLVRDLYFGHPPPILKMGFPPPPAVSCYLLLTDPCWFYFFPLLHLFHHVTFLFFRFLAHFSPSLSPVSNFPPMLHQSITPIFPIYRYWHTIDLFLHHLPEHSQANDAMNHKDIALLSVNTFQMKYER